MVECLILFTGFTDALWPLNLNISDDFKVHSKGAFNNCLLKKRGKGSKMLCSGYKNCPGGQKMAKVFLHNRKSLVTNIPHFLTNEHYFPYHSCFFFVFSILCSI